MPFAIRNQATKEWLHVTRGSSKVSRWRGRVEEATTWPQAHHARAAAVCAVESDDIDDDVIFEVIMVKVVVYPSRTQKFRVDLKRRNDAWHNVKGTPRGGRVAMGENTGIAWTTHTFNPVWGCVKVSPACTNCYAETFANRFNAGLWGPNSERRTFGEKHWREPLKWNAAAMKAGKVARVFCASMSDVFEDHPTWDAERPKLWDLIRATPWLDWLLLTKRPENIRRMLPGPYFNGAPRLSNVWLGTTVESQDYVDRAGHLLSNPAWVHFLSCEPLLGDLDLRRYLWPEVHREGADRKSLDWVITGCESGAKARPQNLEHVRSLRDQCSESGVAFFYKQGEPDGDLVTLGDGSWSKASGKLIEQPYLDGVQHVAVPRGRREQVEHMEALDAHAADEFERGSDDV